MAGLLERVSIQARRVFKTPSAGICLALTIMLGRLVFASSIVPPWQGPDEPQSLGRVRVLEAQEDMSLADIAHHTAEVEPLIIQSMADYGWWKHYSESRPEPLPTRFDELSQHLNSITGPFEPLYHMFAARYLRLRNVTELLDQYFALRALSIVFSLATIWCVWAGARRLFDLGTANGIAALLALHPQFALTSLVVGPVGLANLIAAFVWWQSSNVLRGRHTATSFGFASLAMVLGLWTKRSLGPVLLALGLVAVIAAVRLARKRLTLVPQFVLGVSTAALVGLTFLWGRLPSAEERLRQSWGGMFVTRPPRLGSDYLMEFHRGLFDSAWLYAGWLRHPAPTWWFSIVLALCVASALGLGVAWMRDKAGCERPGIALAVGFVIVQMGAIYATFIPHELGAQGHYLFPVIGPLVTLLWLGFMGWWPKAARAYAAAALLMLMAGLDASGWLTVVVPAYL